MVDVVEVVVDVIIKGGPSVIGTVVITLYGNLTVLMVSAVPSVAVNMVLSVVTPNLIDSKYNRNNISFSKYSNGL